MIFLPSRPDPASMWGSPLSDWVVYGHQLGSIWKRGLDLDARNQRSDTLHDLLLRYDRTGERDNIGNRLPISRPLHYLGCDDRGCFGVVEFNPSLSAIARHYTSNGQEQLIAFVLCEHCAYLPDWIEINSRVRIVADRIEVNSITLRKP